MDLNNIDAKDDGKENDEKVADQGPRDYSEEYDGGDGDHWADVNYMGRAT